MSQSFAPGIRVIKNINIIKPIAAQALKNPTVAPLSDGDWVAVITIVKESVVRSIIFKLKQAGAQGIVEFPLNKIIP